VDALRTQFDSLKMVESNATMLDVFRDRTASPTSPHVQ
jgi:hypothetical protein